MRLADSQVFAMLGRKDLRHLVAQSRLERLVGTPELAALVARTGGDFASAVSGAERAATLVSEPSPSLSRRKHAGAAAALFKKVKTARALVAGSKAGGGKGASSSGPRKSVPLTSLTASEAQSLPKSRRGSDASSRRSSDPAGGGGFTGAAPSAAPCAAAETVDADLEKQMAAEALGAGMSLMDATASTAAAGHLFKWIAHVLAGVCELADLDRLAKGPMEAAAAELRAAEIGLAKMRTECERLRKAEAEAREAQQRHDAESRLQERARTAAQVVPYASPQGATRGAAHDDVTSFRSVDEDEEEDEEAETPAAERRARELEAFQASVRERENALRRKIIAEGGELMRS